MDGKGLKKPEIQKEEEKRPEFTADTPGVTQLTREYLRKQKKVKIIIPKTEQEKGDVYIAVNGHNYLIQRGQEVEIPEDVLQVLDHAVIEEYVQKRSPDGEGYTMEKVEVKRFPYQIVRS